MSWSQDVELPVGGSILRRKDIPTSWGTYLLVFYSEPTYQPTAPFIYRLVVLEPGVGSVNFGHVIYSFAPTDNDWSQLTRLETSGFDLMAVYLPWYGSQWFVYENLLHPYM